jgi:ureidoglycolate hydrolase
MKEEALPRAIKQIKAQKITTEGFHYYGQVIFPREDGNPYDHNDAQLLLQDGIPRLYIMHLENRGMNFDRITRHLKCTQCLGSLDGKEWFMGVATPGNFLDPIAKPDLDEIMVFRIPGNCFIKLNIGTWHAGPFFESESVDFYNLELSDTNITDHHTCNLVETYGIEFAIVP